MKLTQLFLLIFILLFLAACGGGDETAESGAVPDADSDLVGAVPEEASPDGSADAAVEEAAAPTDVPQPTEPPPTDTPEPTAEPQPQPAADGWGEAGTTAQTACDYPYFPMRQGATWTFSDGADAGMTWEILDVQGDLQQATATMQMTPAGEDFSFTYTWECSADKGLVSFDFASQGLGQLGSEMEMTVDNGSGQFLPPAEKIEPGYTWDTAYTSTFAFKSDDSEEALNINGDMEVEQTNTVLSTDPVTVDGLTADGLQLEQVSVILMNMMMMDQSVPSEISMRGILEMGRGIGVVKQTSFTDFGDVTMNLVEWYVP